MVFIEVMNKERLDRYVLEAAKTADYEPISWLTQRYVEQHRPAFKLVSRRGNTEIVVRIHGNEKYPWRFPGAATERGAISAGDYTLVVEAPYAGFLCPKKAPLQSQLLRQSDSRALRPASRFTYCLLRQPEGSQ